MSVWMYLSVNLSIHQSVSQSFYPSMYQTISCILFYSIYLYFLYLALIVVYVFLSFFLYIYICIQYTLHHHQHMYSSCVYIYIERCGNESNLGIAKRGDLLPDWTNTCGMPFLDLNVPRLAWCSALWQSNMATENPSLKNVSHIKTALWPKLKCWFFLYFPLKFPFKHNHKEIFHCHAIFVRCPEAQNPGRPRCPIPLPWRWSVRRCLVGSGWVMGVMAHDSRWFSQQKGWVSTSMLDSHARECWINDRKG